MPNPRVTLSRESVSEVTEHYLLVAQPLPITGRRALERKAAALGSFAHPIIDIQHTTTAHVVAGTTPPVGRAARPRWRDKRRTFASLCESRSM